MTVMTLMATALMLQQVVIQAREPLQPSRWVESVQGQCAGQELLIRQTFRPSDRDVEILINRRPASGDLSALKAALSGQTSAYRFTVQCGTENNEILLRWVRGTSDASGDVSFEVGRATFSNGALAQSSFEAADAESFWYR